MSLIKWTAIHSGHLTAANAARVWLLVQDPVLLFIRVSQLGKVSEWWRLARYPENRRPARPVEAPTSRFDSRGCPVHRHPRPRAEEAGRTSSTRLLQLAEVEHLPRAKNEIWYQG